MRIVKKYEFNRKADALRYIDELWVEDEDGNKSRKTYQVEQQDENGDVVMVDKPYIAHVVELGFIQSGGEWDENGEVVVEPIVSEKYSVDVLWESEIEERWNTYEIEVEGKGVHKFL